MGLCCRTVASGSKGNCIYVENSGRALLVDAGISLKRIEQELRGIGKSLENVEGILVTHEHSDHTKALGMLAKKTGLPVYVPYLAAKEIYLCLANSGRIAEADAFRECVRVVETNKCYGVAGINVQTFTVPHDSLVCFGYRFSDDNGEGLLGISTDMGCVTGEIYENLLGCESVIVESNHDPEMLKHSSYPAYLIERIRSDRGHLSNPDCAALCRELVKNGSRNLTLFHLSEENNRPKLAFSQTDDLLRSAGARSGADYVLNVASPAGITEVCG